MSALLKYQCAMEEVSLEWCLSDVRHALNKSVCFKTEVFLLLPRIKAMAYQDSIPTFTVILMRSYNIPFVCTEGQVSRER